MGLIASKPEGGDFELPPAATHIARCYMVIDEGVQETKYGNKHLVRIGWELSNELMEDGRPFVVSKEYAISLHKDSNLTKDLTSWRGRAFTEEELKGFDLFVIADKPCMITIIHNKKDDRTYANISSVTSVPRGTSVPPLFNDLLIFSLDDPNEATFQKIPEWLQKIIRKRIIPAQESAQASQQPEPDFDDDIPF